MAARSEGLFPREGFNLDEELKVPSAGTTLSVNLHHAKTVRIICVAPLADGAIVLGGETIAMNSADADANGVVIAHVRGALLADQPAGTVCTTAGTGSADYYLELVDGTRR